ncbi:MAG TPA: nitrate reductase cytochrome c-type subunit; periplasmic nitrate reductase electron transfer subunit [Thiolapillus brandeum]|uniref:Periplasmic nitrate reductase, electron transfer subunit n=1 Tax=Thiolapillus brandeum TaxID=1076588 RepID=A0A831K5E6_9GAMM|nr:nitrate reductase cytochrome c-type subunit; periplasmic nitrate reductase electron transfer subunit [Thiolapillus brandeum]
MKLIKIALLCGLIPLGLQSIHVVAEPLNSLRGSVDIDETSEMIPNRRSMAVDGGIEVNYEDQPPLIPHSIDKTRITLHENSCLGCHGKENQKITNAVEPPKSHYRTRKGEKLRKISTGRYFCTQCHVPQAYTEPLVENTFQN